MAWVLLSLCLCAEDLQLTVTSYHSHFLCLQSSFREVWDITKALCVVPRYLRIVS